jgi:hypothetical protein
MERPFPPEKTDDCTCHGPQPVRPKKCPKRSFQCCYQAVRPWVQHREKDLATRPLVEEADA